MSDGKVHDTEKKPNKKDNIVNLWERSEWNGFPFRINVVLIAKLTIILHDLFVGNYCYAVPKVRQCSKSCRLWFACSNDCSLVRVGQPRFVQLYHEKDRVFTKWDICASLNRKRKNVFLSMRKREWVCAVSRAWYCGQKHWRTAWYCVLACENRPSQAKYGGNVELLPTIWGFRVKRRCAC